MKIKNLLLLLSFILLINDCKSDKKEVSTTPVIVQKSDEFKLPEWAKDAAIYEINTRQFSPGGDLQGIKNLLPRLEKMGVDILWLMPVHPISELKRKATGDVLVKDITDPEERKKYYGSPYAVADYRKVNPDFGTMQDFKNLVSAVHDRGMKIIIDWVPNHTGWDNPWITAHPEWYTKNAKGEITDPINPDTGESWGWTDVADLDYSNTDMRKAMIASMDFWVSDVGIDGFRVDVAHGIEQSFWDELTPVLMESNPEVFMLAESEVPSHRNDETYHTTYGWSFHHLINEIAQGKKSAADIDKWYAEDRAKFTKGFHMHFTSNHDENTWAGTVFDRLGDAHKSLAALTATFDGMPLLYSGQEEPMKKRLPFFTKEYIGFKDYAYADFYKILFDLKEKNSALWNGAYGSPLTKISDHDEIYAFKRNKGKDTVIGIFNLSDQRQSFTLSEDMQLTDVFTNQKVDWKKDTALGLEPWQFYVLSSN